MNPPPARPPASSADDGTVAGLLQLLAATRPGADAELIKRAYETASYWHRGQQRKSGDAYITHPVAVASILAEAGADDQTLCAALLHDILASTSYRLAALREEFGAEIAGLVTGAMAPGASPGRQITPSDTRSASTIASDCDNRMVAIKVADRLHNMRTVRHLPPTAQVRASRHTQRVLVPAAGRLGLEAIRAELENLAADALTRNGFRTVTVSGRFLAVAAALLPGATRTRWREEWCGELSVLPTRRERVAFAAHILAGMPRLAATLRRRARRKQAQ